MLSNCYSDNKVNLERFRQKKLKVYVMFVNDFIFSFFFFNEIYGFCLAPNYFSMMVLTFLYKD